MSIKFRPTGGPNPPSKDTHIHLIGDKNKFMGEHNGPWSLSKEIVACPDNQYDKWVSQLSGIKPKKRKKWKNHTYNEYGERRKVIYNEPYFCCRIKCSKEWAIILPASQVFAKLKETKCGFQLRDNNIKKLLLMMRTGGVDNGFCETYNDMRESNLTGNHNTREDRRKTKVGDWHNK